jgi:hypothetical protein
VVDQKEAKMAANAQKMEQMAAEARMKQSKSAGDGLVGKGDITQSSQESVDKGGKGKGGRRKGGKGEVNLLRRGPTTPSADALDLSAEAFPGLPRPTGQVLGKSLLLKNKESEKTETVNKAANMNKFIRESWGGSLSK